MINRFMTTSRQMALKSGNRQRPQIQRYPAPAVRVVRLIAAAARSNMFFAVACTLDIRSRQLIAASVKATSD